jgi:hypothetical protein
MDFKSLINKINSLNDEVKTVAAPTIAPAVQLNEDAQLRVLSGRTTYVAEAKKKAEEAKKEKEVEEGFDADSKTGDTFKTAKGTATKTATGMKHTRDKYDYDPGSDDKEDKKRKETARKAKKESVDADAFKGKFAKMVEAKKDEKKDPKKKPMKEAAKPDFLDIDGDGDKKEPMKKAAADKKKGAPAAKKEKMAEGGASMPGNQYLSIPADKTKLSIGQRMARDGITYSGDNEREMIGQIAKYMKDQGESPRTIRYYMNDDDFVADTLSDLRAASMESQQGMAEGSKDKGGAAKKDGEKKGMSDKQAKYFGKKNESVKASKKVVAESVETKLSFKQMVQLVQESGGQQQIDPTDKELFNWATRVASSKLGEGMKAELYAGLIYERNGGVFEMYDVLSEDQK